MNVSCLGVDHLVSATWELMMSKKHKKSIVPASKKPRKKSRLDTYTNNLPALQEQFILDLGVDYLVLVIWKLIILALFWSCILSVFFE